MSVRRVRFVGGVWDGVREVAEPLPREIVVAAETWRQMRWASEEIPAAALFPTDTYRLERFTDATGIPELRYRLREMVR